MTLETNRIFPSSEHFPWNGIRDFARRNRNFLSSDVYTQFSFDIFDEDRNPSQYHIELGFCPSSRGMVDIYGQIEAEDGTFSTLVLDLEKDEGKIEIPTYGIKVDFEGDEFYSYVPEKLPPDLCQFAEDYTRTFWEIIETVINEKGIVQKEIQKRVSPEVALLSTLPYSPADNYRWN